MITKEKIIAILKSHSFNVEDQAGNHLIVVDDDSWDAVATEVKNAVKSTEMKVTDFIGVKATYDEYGQYICAVYKDGVHQKLADLRGWGAIQNLFKTKKGLIDEEKAASFQDELGRWLVDAINEKLERERFAGLFSAGFNR